MSYERRVALVVLALALATGALIAWGPQPTVRVVAQGPTGEAVPASSSIQITFEQAMDRRSAEQRLSLDPAVPGSVAWQGQKLVFRPTSPLRPETTYTVTLDPGVRDEDGRTTAAPISWSFRTRAPLLAYLAGPLGRATGLILADAAGPRTLHEAPRGITALAAAPSGMQLIFAAQQDQQRSALFIADLAGGPPRPLVDDPTASAAAPAWAPDGNLIAYERRGLLAQSGALGPPRLWLAQPDGTALGPVDGEESVNFAPSWSPDSRRLAFTRGTDESLAVNDFASRRISFPASAGEAACWAPDGDSLTFAAFGTDASRSPSLQRATIAGGAATPLAGSEGAASPACSPDGRFVAFVRAEGTGRAIWLLPTEGGAARRLSAPGSAQDLLPTWTPDGASLAFTRVSAGTSGVASAVWSVSLEGQERLLAQNASSPVWLP